jgi:hypothetical protein
MCSNQYQFIDDCRNQRTALKKTVVALKARKKINVGQSATIAQINAALDARIFNCECTIARYEIIITDAEAEAAAK